MIYIFNLLKPFWMGIVEWATIIGSGFLLFFKVRQSGKEAEQHKVMLETLKEVQIRDNIQSNVTSISDNKLNKLRKKWERK